jgi:hypothetical protein
MGIRHTYAIDQFRFTLCSARYIISDISSSNSRLETAGPVSTGPLMIKAVY